MTSPAQHDNQGASHTPGPWEVVPLSGHCGPYSIRMEYNPEQTYYGIRQIHRKADARLIAAAPDGLDVGRGICAILDEHCAHDGEALVYDHEAIGEEVARLHEKLTAYIAKALGQ